VSGAYDLGPDEKEEVVIVGVPVSAVCTGGVIIWVVYNGCYEFLCVKVFCATPTMFI
jgi:hypothetical protein